MENELKNKNVFDISVLSNRSVTITSSYSLLFRFQSRNLHFMSAIRFHFVVQRGSIVMDLPVVRLTETVNYVTSPHFNGLDLLYPYNYSGVFHLHVSDDESVLISSTYSVLEKSSECYYDYLDFDVAEFNQSWGKCGKQDILPQVYRSSVVLFFRTDSSYEFIGFKMMQAIFPRSQEPEQLPGNLFDCSVPNFYSFRPVVNCNMVIECQGNEDEVGCSYHSDDCGDGALDA